MGTGCGGGWNHLFPFPNPSFPPAQLELCTQAEGKADHWSALEATRKFSKTKSPSAELIETSAALFSRRLTRTAVYGDGDAGGLLDHLPLSKPLSWAASSLTLIARTSASLSSLLCNLYVRVLELLQKVHLMWGWVASDSWELAKDTEMHSGDFRAEEKSVPRRPSPGRWLDETGWNVPQMAWTLDKCKAGAWMGILRAFSSPVEQRAPALWCSFYAGDSHLDHILKSSVALQMSRPFPMPESLGVRTMDQYMF